MVQKSPQVVKHVVKRQALRTSEIGALRANNIFGYNSKFDMR